MDVLDPVFRDYVLTTVFHQSLADLADDRISAIRLDELIVLHGKVTQLANEAQQASARK